MPAAKPADLVVRNDGKRDRRRRAKKAADLTSKKALTVHAPVSLTGEVARRTWQETVRQYLTLDARIVSVLDKRLLMDYCTACQEESEIQEMRTAAYSNYLKSEALLQKIEFGKQPVEPKVLLKLIAAVNKEGDWLLKLDARVDIKRKLIHLLSQSLMLTPRSRGGVSPDEKAPVLPPTRLEQIIDGSVKPEPGPKENGNV